ncbi:MAG: 50S ribosomal protein L33 [Chloroflexi bacterium]|nr:50S ribosomal protein L33 [Chloroflexota bacterium]
MAKKGDRVLVTMQCTECGERNYRTSKNRRSDPQRLELNKYCNRCYGRQLYREVR